MTQPNNSEWGRPTQRQPGPQQPSAPGSFAGRPAGAPPAGGGRQIPVQRPPTGAPRPASGGQSSTARPPVSAPPPSPPAVQPASSPAARPAPAPRPPARSPAPSRRAGIGCSGLLLALLFAVALALLAAGIVLAGYAAIARDLPPPDELRARASQFASTLIYDREGALLSEVGDPNFGRRTAVRLDEIAPALIDATIATEDPNFWDHPGVDPVGIARAVYYAIRERDFENTPGGSTITQQLVKLTFLSSERTMERKIKEAILAAEITRRYSRETILEIYLNEIYYGNLAYGIEAAAETYFGKHASELTLGQAALLAGLPQAPAYYDPYTRLWESDGKPGAVKRRQAAVLRLMVERGAITPAQADAAWVEPLVLVERRRAYDSRYPHFVQYARNEIERRLGPEQAAKGGLRIYTTLDPRLQAIAEEEVARQVDALRPQNATNGALVAIRPATGEVLALVGSRSFYSETISGQINMTLAPRQPGSAIKPFTYLATFEMPAAVNPDPNQARAAQAAPGASQISAIEPPGYWAPGTALMDIRTEFPDGANPPYVPANYDEKEHGLLTVRTALGNSYNIPAVKALEHAGLERLKDVARRGGITTLTRPDYGLALTLGGGEVTLLELTGAYAALANGGVRVAPTPVACVLDRDGRLIWRAAGAEAITACGQAAARPGPAPLVTPAPGQAAYSPQHAYLITDILSDPVARQPMFTGSPWLTLPGRPAAVKTGTTNDYRDAWTLGYTPELAVGVWVGNADYKPMLRTAGSIGAAPIWHTVMRRGLEGKPAQPFTPPAGMQRVEVCTVSGTLPSVACPARRSELFAQGQGPLPAAYDLWQRVRVDKVTGRRANEFTPADRVEERDLMVFPLKYRAWAEANGKPQVTDAIELAFPPELALREPAGGARITGVVPVQGKVRLPPPLVWRVEYGVGPNPIGWGVIAGPVQGDTEGVVANWDTARPAAQHNVEDFSVRLAAYEPGVFEYPIAVSNVAYVRVLSPTATPTVTPSATPSPTRTATASPTAAATATATATAPASPTPTRTAGPTPTGEPTGQATATPRPTAVASPLPPTATATPLLTSAPTAPPSPTPTALAGALRALITAPVERAQVSGQAQITGTAAGAGFASYRLEYAEGLQPLPDAWRLVAPPQIAAVADGVLGTWDTRTLRPGPYVLRLLVIDNRGTALVVQVAVEVVR